MSSQHCQTCGGLIMTPGVPYVYSGKICNCPYPQPERNQQVQRSSGMPSMGDQLIHERLQNLEEIMEAILDQLDQLEGLLIDDGDAN